MGPRIFKSLLSLSLFTLLSASAAGGCGGTESRPATTPSNGASQAMFPDEVASFDYVWSAIDRTHWDPEKVGESWDAARDELRPKIVAATTVGEARGILRSLIASLGQSHFAISGGEVAAADQDFGGNGTLGFDVRLIDGAPVVWRLAEGGPAATSKITKGMIVESVAGRLWTDVLAKNRASPASKGKGSYEEGSLASMFIRGKVGAEVKLSVIDGAGAKKDIVAEWGKAPGTTASFGVLKDITVEYESSELSASIGYVRLSVFFDPMTVSQRFKADIERFQGKAGLIFDLRGNPGGIGGMAMGLGGRLVSEKGSKLGTMISRNGRLDFVLNPQPGAFTGKVAILVDGMCASTCEILAAGLEDIGRATVFGTRTAGAALPSQMEELPNGAIFQYATANYVSVSGRILEHDGLTPTQVVPLTRESLLSGSDSQIAAATAWIQN
ncbi:MAG: hypothetical protein GY811_01355 [Myxococcales bacterium]|nr:hypothetical protein [Myxococcales bacterium]